jgi:transcription elongation factor SPT6
MLIDDARKDKEGVPGQGGGGEAEPAERQRVMAKTEAELSRGLFYESEGDEEQQLQQQKLQKKQEMQKNIERKMASKVERFDEDGMDDFIDDDIGDQGQILASDRRGNFDEDNRDVSEAQLNEASEIFGTDYLEFMATEQPDEEEEELLGKYRERGVGIEMGGDSEDEVISDDDDDDDDGLFGDEDEEGIAGTGSHQKAEALRLKREKRKLAKAERRRLAVAKKAERRKAQIRRVFEPVQLVENFCTDRDDEIRQSDIPERLFDWKTPFHGSKDEGMTEDERAEAMWIVGRIPDIMTEFHAAALQEDRQNSVLESIANALRFMHRDKLEPAFIKRYRKDYVTSPAVQANLYDVMDEDGEWERVLGARAKVKNLLQNITSVAEGDASMGADVQNLRQMQESLAAAQEELEETAKQESLLKGELGALGDADDDDDDDELFGDDEENSEVS